MRDRYLLKTIYNNKYLFGGLGLGPVDELCFRQAVGKIAPINILGNQRVIISLTNASLLEIVPLSSFSLADIAL